MKILELVVGVPLTVMASQQRHPVVTVGTSCVGLMWDEADSVSAAAQIFQSHVILVFLHLFLEVFLES